MSYSFTNISGFIWQGLVDTLSGPGYGFSLIGLVGLILLLGMLFVRGADFGLILIATMLFMMVAAFYGLFPGFVLYTIYAIGAGIILLAIYKMAGGG